MKPRERVFRAMDLEEPDRVPIFDWGLIDNPSNVRIVEEVIGRRIADQGTQAGFINLPSPEILDGLVDCCVKLGLDMTAPHLVTLLPKEVSKGVIRDEWGVKWLIDADAYGRERYWWAGPAVESLDDLDDYEIPDPHAEGRMDAVRSILKLAADRVVIAGTPDNGVDEILGFQNMVRALYRGPRTLERFLDRVLLYNIEVGKAMIDEGIEIILSGHEYGTFCEPKGPMISPQLIRKLFLPRLESEIRSLKKHGLAFFMTYQAGEISSLMGDFIKVGFDGVHPFERPYMDLANAKEMWGDRICVLGNVPVTNTSVVAVQRMVKECINVAAPGGGYVLSSNDSIFGNVKTENFLAMTKATRKYGMYPHTSSMS